MPYLLKGALVEYGSDFLGPVPNAVIFQFNPESMIRTIQIPERPTGAASRETTQAGEIPIEKITLTAHFNASDQLNNKEELARTSGIGPQLAALEKMVHPTEEIMGLIGKTVDKIGDMLSSAASGTPQKPAVELIPRSSYPRILFIWGLTRILPVIIDSMNITEKQYDSWLNPVQAEVTLGLTVITPDPCSSDMIAKGALEYSNIAKEAMATANLVVAAREAADLIPF